MEPLVRAQFYLDVAQEVELLAKRAGPETAVRWSDALELTIEELMRQPHLGRLRKDLKPDGVRSWRIKKFRRWMVFYQIDQDSLILLRVRYGMMDLPTLNY